ncbi:type II secretion system F family protein [Streptacidiphilus rugosus]|uniref:type II secretion system F family protein n=1 Tax=Streptacidiphilus rugosus TaxID=405783 RepID=UPI001E657406|nr:type II secretion system F family protein [Streptacidiphilus rugosus]
MSGGLVWASAALSGGTALAVGLTVRRRRGLIRRRAGRFGLQTAPQGGAGAATPSAKLPVVRLAARRAASPASWAASVRSEGRAAERDRLVPRLASMLIGAGAVALVGGQAGWVLGVALTALGLRLLPAPPGRAEQQRRRSAAALRSQLPLAADLLAGCLASWCPPDAALTAVATAVAEPIASRLATAAVELSIGADPEACWERLGDTEPALAPLGRCLARAAASGAPPAAGLARLADAERASAAREAQARVRRAGVLATAPLGLCFLPAFVLVGVVPVVTGLAGSFLGRL